MTTRGLTLHLCHDELSLASLHEISPSPKDFVDLVHDTVAPTRFTELQLSRS